MKQHFLGLALVTCLTSVAQAQTYGSYGARPGTPAYAMPPGAPATAEPTYGEQPVSPEGYGGEMGHCSSRGEFGCGGTCSSRLWFQGDALLWFTSDTRLPPLVTSSPTGTPLADAGILGEPDTFAVIGDEDIGDELRLGGRFTIGYWLDDCQGCGLETTFFFLEDESERLVTDSEENSILTRPFFDVSTGTQRGQLIAFPGIATGSVTVEGYSEVAGSETMLRKRVEDNGCRRTDFIFGYRYFRLDEGIRIADQLTSISGGGTIPLGTTIEGFDNFETENEFHGGQIGVVFHYDYAYWSARVLGKVAMGNMEQIVAIEGQTETNVPGGGATVTDAGLLVQRSNDGEFNRDEFAVIPEVGLNLAYAITPRLKATAGYTFIYISNVSRPDDHINLAINPTQSNGPLVGERAPRFAFKDTDYWVQGVNFGLEYNF